jgi:hypothetical protein
VPLNAEADDFDEDDNDEDGNDVKSINGKSTANAKHTNGGVGKTKRLPSTPGSQQN